MLRTHWRIVIDVALYATLVTLYALSGTVLSVPLAVAQLVPLVWRRRAPGTALAVISVATAAHSLLGMGRAVGYLPVSLAMYTAATHRSPAVRWGMCGAAAAVDYTSAMAADLAGRSFDRKENGAAGED